MNSRRSFLTMLGLGAVAAPAIAKAVQAEAAPVDTWPPTNSEFRSRLAAQREINRIHSRCVHTHTISPAADPSHTHSISYWPEDAQSRTRL